MSHIQRETSCSRPRLNSNMDADLYGYKWARDNVGQSGATIYRLYGKPHAPELFLKHGKGSVANDVTDEMVRLNWLTEFMPLPTIKHFIRTPDDAFHVQLHQQKGMISLSPPTICNSAVDRAMID